VRVLHVHDTRELPFPNEHFDWVSCNSVLEYVDPDHLEGVLREVDRVLKKRGKVAIIGTSNRLWPGEDHSGLWFVNYLPWALYRVFTRTPVTRGVSPLRLRRVLREYDDLTSRDNGRPFVALKQRMGAPPLAIFLARVLGIPLGWVGVTAGVLAPTITMVLQKR
jgi:SAM-dependent methyltransferase